MTKPELKQLVLKCILAWVQNNPPPKDVSKVSVRAASNSQTHSRYENMATYIAEQILLTEAK